MKVQQPLWGRVKESINVSVYVMSSNNCVEVLGNCISWEVRCQLRKHYVINANKCKYM